MKDFQEFIKGKKITVMGLGLLGRGLGDIKFLAENGVDIIVTDLKTKEELSSSIKELEHFSNITFVLGEHRIEDFENADLVLRAPNAPLDSPYLKAAENKRVHITQSTALFAKFVKREQLIGITGTRGKSTTTQLISHVLKTAGKEVITGGNVQGISTLSLLPTVTENSLIVLELDSWQLQSFGTEKLSPHVAVFTTFMKDHMNYYKGDVDRYLLDKAQIFLNQTSGDHLVLGEDIYEIVTSTYKDQIRAEIHVGKREPVSSDLQERLPGKHNALNIACAIEVLKLYGLEIGQIENGIKSFEGVPGRLEYLGDKNGIRIYNDTTATTPDAAIAALEALDMGNKNIVLIAGGSDKELEMDNFVREAIQKTKKTILLSGTGTDKIKMYFENSPIVNSLEEALKEAFSVAEKGDTILLSPAFASFGMFKNEYDRGDQFKNLIKVMPTD